MEGINVVVPLPGLQGKTTFGGLFEIKYYGTYLYSIKYRYIEGLLAGVKHMLKIK